MQLLDQGVSLGLSFIFALVINTLYLKKLGRDVQKNNFRVSLANILFSSKQTQRKFPIQAALHICLNGVLIGVLIVVAIVSSVALHSQYLWSEAFTKLQKTRDLNRRILESTSILESHLLKDSKLSKSLVPTKVENLIYIDLPSKQSSKLLVNETYRKRILERISNLSNQLGY